MYNKKEAKAFTLSEVLITLVIIGVIAAITIPGILVSTNKQDTISKLKAANSIVGQVQEKAFIDHGSIETWDMDKDEEQFGKTYLKPYVNYVKECTSMADGCWVTDNFNGYYDLKGDRKTTTVPYSLILNNGMIIGVNKIVNMFSFIVDINGRKKPNRLGRDVFSFYIFNPKTSYCRDDPSYNGTDIPAGIYIGGADNCGPPHIFYPREELLSTSVLRACNKNANAGEEPRPGVGTACGAVIVIDGWQIKKDYPW